jgi:D-glycerate 3-kinase
LRLCSGPLLKKIGFTPEMVGQRIDEWLALGVKLSRQLQFDEFALSESEKVRVYHYYVPVFLWCKRELEAHTAKFKLGEPVPALVVINTTPCSLRFGAIRYSTEACFAMVAV